jgi:ethanolamine utilization protein EutQ (cupin superfamily)
MTRTKITRREVDVIRKKFIEEIINELKTNGNEAKKAKIIKEEKSFWSKNCDFTSVK